MLRNPEKPEIDHRTLKLLVGVIAMTLGSLTNKLAGGNLASISEAYWRGGWPESIFVGFLFAISAFLFAYNGRTRGEMVSSKIAAVAALGVALYPCECGGHPVVKYVHYGSAAVMFLVLAYFCYEFHRRAHDKHYREADRRAIIYAVCGVVIVGVIVILGVNGLRGGALEKATPGLVFWGEHTALWAFGLSWLTASKILPVVTTREERLSLLRPTPLV